MPVIHLPGPQDSAVSFQTSGRDNSFSKKLHCNVFVVLLDSKDLRCVFEITNTGRFFHLGLK